MPSDDYAAVGGGALKLKGAKVDKKKKKKRDKTDLEKNLATDDKEKKQVVKRDDAEASDEKDKDKREGPKNADGEEDGTEPQKTEAELRYEEFKKKRLLKMAEQSASRPELLKTHKERVEELNTYLSKLSEHHDMPKIGPG